MEPDPGNIKDIGNIKKILKINKNESVMPAHAECTNRTFNVLALLTKNCNVFFSRTQSLCILLVFLSY